MLTLSLESAPLDEMAVWIKMPLGMEVGLSLGDFVFDGNLAPPEKKAQPLTQELDPLKSFLKFTLARSATAPSYNMALTITSIKSNKSSFPTTPYIQSLA